jgi:hypothetical protein
MREYSALAGCEANDNCKSVCQKRMALYLDIIIEPVINIKILEPKINVKCKRQLYYYTIF